MKQLIIVLINFFILVPLFLLGVLLIIVGGLCSALAKEWLMYSLVGLVLTIVAAFGLKVLNQAKPSQTLEADPEPTASPVQMPTPTLKHPPTNHDD